MEGADIKSGLDVKKDGYENMSCVLSNDHEGKVASVMPKVFKPIEGLDYLISARVLLSSDLKEGSSLTFECGNQKKTLVPSTSDTWQTLEWIVPSSVVNGSVNVLFGFGLAVDDIVVRPVQSTLSVSVFNAKYQLLMKMANGGPYTMIGYDSKERQFFEFCEGVTLPLQETFSNAYVFPQKPYTLIPNASSFLTFPKMTRLYKGSEAMRDAPCWDLGSNGGLVFESDLRKENVSFQKGGLSFSVTPGDVGVVTFMVSTSGTDAWSRKEILSFEAPNDSFVVRHMVALNQGVLVWSIGGFIILVENRFSHLGKVPDFIFKEESPVDSDWLIVDPVFSVREGFGDWLIIERNEALYDGGWLVTQGVYESWIIVGEDPIITSGILDGRGRLIQKTVFLFWMHLLGRIRLQQPVPSSMTVSAVRSEQQRE